MSPARSLELQEALSLRLTLLLALLFFFFALAKGKGYLSSKTTQTHKPNKIPREETKLCFFFVLGGGGQPSMWYCETTPEEV